MAKGAKTGSGGPRKGGRPKKYATVADAVKAGSWRAIRKLKDEQEASRPVRAGLTVFDPGSVLDEVGLRRETPRLLGVDPWSNGVGFSYDHAAGVRAVEFFHTRLTHVKGHLALQPVELEFWQQAIVLNLFGWKDGDGLRRYRTAFVYVPRKNGKTTLATGIVLYVLTDEGELGKEVYSAAADLLQAALIYDLASSMIHQDPGLSFACRVLGTTKRIEDVTTNSFYRALSAEAGTKHGLNPSCFVVDELHAQPSRDLVDVLKTGTGSRREPLEVYITTADFERPSICNEMHEYAGKVKSGQVDDPRFLPVIFEALPEDDWTDPAVWAKANPNLGVSVNLDYLERECARAKEIPEYQNTFKRLHLNIRTTSDVVWLDMGHWDSCSGEVVAADLEGARCYGGLDLASTRDLTAFVLVFPDHENAVLPYFWVPRETATSREAKGLKPSYLAWSRDGFMELTDGSVCDYDRVRARIVELGRSFDIQEIAFDRWGAQQLVTQLQGDGFEMTAFGQGYASMSAPSKELEKLVLGGSLRHGGHPVLRWNAGNVMLETDAAGNIKPSKKKSSEKIDGVVGLVMALGLCIVNEKPAEWSPEVFIA